ncbi:DNA-binding transcriptional regulator, XRE-family HTH domain [Actinomadura meyerae]|uniref:DNA-binding transcriptional regulator, XRE-family HTH domain n=1 Tax=Actinomadura meyerae TaxID=240840 RepID=A0A239FM14_9ACTN|nr:helix-turn-helix transcriptional regulator [Actinomadura meyerae]SNS57857.1 DNA-binding transcriptional regulator, XRE-family HTH domain [Actinomadura meyerae]
MASDQHDLDALRIHFGEELRRMRQRAKLSQNQLAAALGCTPQWICQLEKADKTVSEQTALDLDTHFKTDGWDQNDGHFLRLYKTIRRAGRHRVLRPGFEAYLQFEPKAIGIRCFAAQILPGLLQIEDYARAIMDPSEPAGTLDKRVTSRMERQGLLFREKPAMATFILDESVLRRPVGGPEVMGKQIDHLISMARLPHVQLLIMPFERITPEALSGGLILLSFVKDPDLVYIESGAIGQLLDDKDEVFMTSVYFNRMMGDALSRLETIEFMRQAKEAYL